MYTEYIKIENGEVKSHPITLENLQQLHPNFLENYESLGYLPCAFMPAPVAPTSYSTVDTIYTINGNVVLMNYVIRVMTPEEKAIKIASRLNDPKPYPSWILDEEICDYVAPVAYPNDGFVYNWDEETTSWVLANE